MANQIRNKFNWQHFADKRRAFLNRRYGRPCGSQHSAGKRAGFNQNSEAESSGGQHSASERKAILTGSSHSARDLSVLLLDEEPDDFGKYNVEDLVYDPRPQLDPDELEEILREKSADIVMKVASVGLGRIEWNFTCSSSCQIFNKPTIKLHRSYVATPFTLRRLTPCNDGKTIKFILVKQ